MAAVEGDSLVVVGYPSPVGPPAYCAAFSNLGVGVSTLHDLPVSVPAFHGRRRLRGLNVGAVDLKTFFFPPAHTC